MSNLDVYVLLVSAFLWSGLSLAQEDVRSTDLPASNATYISLGGKITSVDADSFLLDAGTHRISVEMDDYNDDADASMLRKGDRVTVYGLVDDNLFSNETIEASSIYVERLNNKYFANSLDEEERALAEATPLPASENIALQGQVSRVNPYEYEFELEAGDRDVRVEILDLPDNPLDERGQRRLREGDVVRVEGRWERDFLEGREIDAQRLEVLRSA